MDNRTIHEPNTTESIRDAVCVDCSRIYDSCADKDCLEDLQVFFPDDVYDVVDQACSVRLKDVSVLNVLIDTEKVPFNKGFYTVDMTFYFKVEVEVCRAPGSPSCCVIGVCCFNKKVILYGSEGNVSIFSSEFRPDSDGCSGRPGDVQNMPKATVQVADPIGLEARIVDCCECCSPCPGIPDCICQQVGFNGIHPRDCSKKVFVSIGLFSIVQLQRNVQLLLPAYDFCIPEHESIATSGDNPCDLFRKIEFPTDEFFPPKNNDCTGDCNSTVRKDCRYC